MPRPTASRRAAALSPIARIAAGGGTDPAQPSLDDRFGEVGVLGEEPEPRMHRIGSGVERGLDDRPGIEQVERARSPVRRG